MKLTSENVQHKIRIANFSSLNLPFSKILQIGSDNPDRIVEHLRTYADLPYVYVVPKGKEELVLVLLSKLKAIRSTCYPYAIYTNNRAAFNSEALDLDVLYTGGLNPEETAKQILEYGAEKFSFNGSRLRIDNTGSLPDTVDVLIVGGGITGLYAAGRLKERNISFCIVEKRDIIGGIWSKYANTVSQVNSSECAYRLIEPETRANRDHSTTKEILEDMVQLSQDFSDHIYLNTEVTWIEKHDHLYHTDVTSDGTKRSVKSKGIILAINDRVGEPRVIEWKNQEKFKGDIVAGISDENKDLDWRNKKVVIVGMGAFAIENARTALEAGAKQVTVICRRHGTVCPKIIDYLNFATPYDEDFQHENKSNMRNMMFWKKLYNLSGATQPECWMSKIKHTGHTISVSDIWFIGHYLNKLNTITGKITDIFENGVVVNAGNLIETDIIINCVGFHSNAKTVKRISNYETIYNNNYIDKDLMYLADAFIDDDVFNSFFGSSVLEMAKFYMSAYIKFFNNPEFNRMIKSEGMEKIPVEQRSWSHYIAGANALIKNYSYFRTAAMDQVTVRSQNFLEAHDLKAYITENKREWIDTHALLAGKPMKEEECLPYLFEKLIEKG
jgi:cation diffusion facilitator CzcD-associated flavoprotein CzcO